MNFITAESIRRLLQTCTSVWDGVHQKVNCDITLAFGFTPRSTQDRPQPFTHLIVVSPLSPTFVSTQVFAEKDMEAGPGLDVTGSPTESGR